MDALLSLPVFGYLLMPGLTSYSTSLNLLFFYMTWSTLVLSHSPLKVEVFGTLGIRLVFFLAPSSLFLLFDTVIPSLAVGIKKTRRVSIANSYWGCARIQKGRWAAGMVPRPRSQSVQSCFECGDSGRYRVSVHGSYWYPKCVEGYNHSPNAMVDCERPN